MLLVMVKKLEFIGINNCFLSKIGSPFVTEKLHGTSFLSQHKKRKRYKSG
jgi:hypothetical protein